MKIPVALESGRTRLGTRQFCGCFVFQSCVSTKTVVNSAHTSGLVLATSPCNKSSEEITRCDRSQGLVPWTVHNKRFEEQVAGTSPKNSLNALNSWSLRLNFETKMASSLDGTCPRDLLQGLVPSCVPTLNHIWFVNSLRYIDVPTWLRGFKDKLQTLQGSKLTFLFGSQLATIRKILVARS